MAKKGANRKWATHGNQKILSVQFVMTGALFSLLGWLIAANFPSAGVNAVADRHEEQSEAALPWAVTTHPTIGKDGFNWTQLSLSRPRNFPNHGAVHHFGKGYHPLPDEPTLFHKVFMRSIPAVIHGYETAVSEKLSSGAWGLPELGAALGGNQPTLVSFSPDKWFNRMVEGYVMNPANRQMRLNEAIDLVANQQPGVEHVAIQQSPAPRNTGSRWLHIGKHEIRPPLQSLVRPTASRPNLWMCGDGKVSVFHNDWRDNILVVLAGKKRLWLVDPTDIGRVYPTHAIVGRRRRASAGVFTGFTDSGREVDNYPLVNVTHPDLQRHPLFRDVTVYEVELEAGDALMLPAYWFHQVMNTADEGLGVNVAANFWFQGNSLATRLLRLLRENVFIDCTTDKRSCLPGANPHAQQA